MVKIVAKTAKGRIRNTTKWPRTGLTTEHVAEAFGGIPLNVSLGNDRSPLTLFAIREMLMERLQSTGGRPSLADMDRKPRIPMSSDDWYRLEDFSHVAAPTKTVSPAQIGGLLLHWAISQAINDPELGEQIINEQKRDHHATA